MALQQRNSALSRLVFIPEVSFGSDSGATSGYIMNLAAQSNFRASQGRIEVPVYKGNRRSLPSILGKIMAGGKVPLQLEFMTFSRILKTAFGATGYARPGAGTTTDHRFYTPTGNDAVPGSCQLQEDSLETTLISSRNRGCRVGNIGLKYSPEGAASCDLEFVGIGDESQTQQVASPTDEGFTPVSVFNGFANLNALGLTGLQSMDLSIDFGVQRSDAAFNAGIAASLTSGNIVPTGTIQLIVATTGATPEADFAFYNYAINDSFIPIDVAWANAPLASADQWCRVVMPACKFERNKWTPGGNAGLNITQKFRAESNTPNNNDNIPAEAFGTVRGPYTLPATPNFGVKIDGGGTITVALTAGSQTATQIVAALNAFGAFNAVAVADVFMGRVRVKSKGTSGAGTSVQYDTAVSNSVHTQLGYTATTWVGYSNTPILLQVYNTINSNLP